MMREVEVVPECAQLADNFVVTCNAGNKKLVDKANHRALPLLRAAAAVTSHGHPVA